MNTKATVNSPLFVPLVLLVLCFLAYGLLIPTLGYYWDDWPYAWVNHMFGPAGYPDYVALDRPYSAWIFMGLTAIFGQGPMGYHISALLLYWVCASLFWWLVKLVWPNREREAFLGALLFAIYPGFLGQPQGIIYNHHFAAMALYLFSLFGMVKTLRKPEQESFWKVAALWYLPSIIALLISQFTIEYFLGWEAVRLLLVWIVIKGRKAEGFGRTPTQWLILLPYWLVSLGFLLWRVFVFQFPTYKPFFTEHSFVLQDWLLSIFSQILDASLIAWQYALPRLSNGLFSPLFWVSYLALWIASAVLVFFIVRLWDRKKKVLAESRPVLEGRFGRQALGVALVGCLFAGLPFWLTGLSVDIGNRFLSRFTLPFIPWTALLFISTLHFISKIRLRWVNFAVTVLLAILVGGSTAWHFWNANIYRNDWMEVQRYFRQLVERMPGIEPGTSLVVNDMRSLSLYQDDSLTAILNWTYAPDFDGEQMPYMMQYLSVRLGDEIPALQPGLPIEHDYRSLNFSGSTDRIIVVHYQPEGCVRVLDESDRFQLPTGFPGEMIAALPLSDLSLIQSGDRSPASPPLHLFDLEMKDTWCINFQKADLAAQEGDWEQVVSWGDYAFGSSQEASELTEMFVFLEGYLRLGRMETAREISQDVSVESDGLLDDEICTLWQQVEAEIGVNLDIEGLDICLQFN